jgi:membrane protease YdiL (CAAX protease family)
MVFRIKLHWWSSLSVSVVALVVAWRLGGLENLLGNFGTTWAALAAGTAGALGCLVINYALHASFRLILGDSYSKKYYEFAMDVIRHMGPVDALAAGVMAAVAEEPLFRGVLLPALGGSAWGVVGSAVVFGIAHFLRREYWGFFLWGIGEGLVFGMLYVLTGSILVPAVAHGTFDTIGFLYFEQLRKRGGL